MFLKPLLHQTSIDFHVSISFISALCMDTFPCMPIYSEREGKLCGLDENMVVWDELVLYREMRMDKTTTGQSANLSQI